MQYLRERSNTSFSSWHAVATTVLLSVSVAQLLSGQTPSSRRQASPPKTVPGGANGYAVRPIVLKDEGCARDYLKATLTGGVELRKRIAELMDYECLEKGSHIYRTVGLAKPHRVEVGGKSYLLYEVVLIQDVGMEALAKGNDGTSLPDTDISDPDVYRKGWITGDQFLAYSKEKMEAFIKDTVRHPH